MSITPGSVKKNVQAALAEDIGAGDITASLIQNKQISATLITRERGILCGLAWFNEVFHQLDSGIRLHWRCADGDSIRPRQIICTLQGAMRPILSGERTALNFLQMLSGTASTTAHYVGLIKDSKAKIRDTRKTIPSLRDAQKYAVCCGGGINHRHGLYDGILIKENHIISTNGIGHAISLAKQKNVPVEIEVESLAELETALVYNPDQILLDNFSIDQLRQAVTINHGRVQLEASGNIDQRNIHAIASTGIDYIAIGALTKHIHAIDFSMRFNQKNG